VSGSLQSR
jgi:hypothetical protein